jgi:hypothetical protein
MNSCTIIRAAAISNRRSRPSRKRIDKAALTATSSAAKAMSQ